VKKYTLPVLRSPFASGNNGSGSRQQLRQRIPVERSHIMENTERFRLSMLLQLARNDIKSRYSNSLLGIAWAFAMPLATILVFWVVFQLGFKNLPVGDAPYILWFASAYIPWIYFTDTLTSGCNCLVEYSYLVKKVKFNVALIPAVKLVSATFVHLFFIGFLCLIRVVYGFPFTIHAIQVLYYSLCAAVLGAGLIYLLSAFTVFFKDTLSIVNILVQIGFWVTPVMWNEETMLDQNIRQILALNPMHYVVSGYRSCFLGDSWFWENPGEGIYFWTFSLITLILGVSIFRKLSPFCADEV